MSVVPISGLAGKAEVSTLNAVPSAGFASDNSQVPLPYNAEPIAPKLLYSNIDYSTRRNVLPCKGITPPDQSRPPLPAPPPCTLDSKLRTKRPS